MKELYLSCGSIIHLFISYDYLTQIFLQLMGSLDFTLYKPR